ncbi:hypothetical protein K2173_004441 [Erythroxylum novogranatense]|uniref:Uncharacterized protein n=1 Tax=Erythroxylum novogranatense TaxID=1862640 RepID=A0AAV8T4H1_9ROSI|nr:hypothetical protein K2173_004441 [Erythroxylum novogranatense]
MMSNQGFGDFYRLRHRSPSPMASSNLISNVAGTGLGGWNGLPLEWTSWNDNGLAKCPASPSSYTVKRILRLEIPVDTYPNSSTGSCIRLLSPRKLKITIKRRVQRQTKRAHIQNRLETFIGDLRGNFDPKNEPNLLDLRHVYYVDGIIPFNLAY